MDWLRENTVSGGDARATLDPDKYQSAEHHASALAHLDKILAGSWKDAKKGRIMFFTETAIPQLDGVLSVPLGFVPKSHPDRTLSKTEGREVVDPAVQNENVYKEHFHPALMPSHLELAKLICWWKFRYPGIDVLLAKKI